MRSILLTLLFIFFWHDSKAQLTHLPTGRYNGKSGQAMAIHEDKAFLFNDGGHCRIFNLPENKILSEHDLTSTEKSNHANAACFGNEFIEGSNIPVLYVTECKNEYRCFVFALEEDSTRLVQTISGMHDGANIKALIWVVDKKKDKIYCVTRSDKTLAAKGYSENTIRSFRLPKLNDGSIIQLSATEAIDSFTICFPNILQDAIIRDNKLYIATGLQQSESKRKDGKRAIQVIDLDKKELIKTIDLTYLTTNEPEGIDFYGDRLFLFCGQEGGIYEITNYK